MRLLVSSVLFPLFNTLKDLIENSKQKNASKCIFLFNKTPKILSNRVKMTENNQYIPILFITLTWKTPTDADSVEIEVRKYVSRLARRYKGHIKKTAAYEVGTNTHAHIVIWALDINPLRVKHDLVVEYEKRRQKSVPRMTSKRMFPFGRVDLQIYDAENYGQRGVFYTLVHTSIPDAGEVFCGSNRTSCKKGRCVERANVAEQNKISREFKTAS
jgi:hypothetical protein